MTAHVVGLYSPFPRSGKSTFAQALLYEAHPSCVLVKFAEGFREYVINVVAPFFDGGEAEARSWMEDDRKDTHVIPGLGVTLRTCFQMAGTLGRSINADLWVKRTEIELQRMHNYKLVVVDDLRYENEYHMLRKRGATLIRVERPDGPKTDAHESNRRLENLPFDYTIVNCGTEADLRLKALGVAWKIGVA